MKCNVVYYCSPLLRGLSITVQPHQTEDHYHDKVRDVKQHLADISALPVHTRTQLMTGQNTSAHLGRSTTTTVELRSPSGRSPKTCWRGKHI